MFVCVCVAATVSGVLLSSFTAGDAHPPRTLERDTMAMTRLKKKSKNRKRERERRSVLGIACVGCARPLIAAAARTAGGR